VVILHLSSDSTSHLFLSIEIAITYAVPTSRLILWLFLLAQVLDGAFTYVAVGTHGVMAEGNVLVATWMALVGPGAALMGAKSLAAACGVLLYGVGKQRVLFALTVFYAVAAVGPWMLLLPQI
jgi:hypothetical protein